MATFASCLLWLALVLIDVWLFHLSWQLGIAGALFLIVLMIVAASEAHKDRWRWWRY